MAAYVPLTNLRGPAARIVEVTAETIPAGQAPEVIMDGPDQGRTFHFKVERGLPGVNALENDEAVATYVAAPDSETGKEVRSTIARSTVPPMATPAIEVYGHSYTVSPSPHVSAGKEFFKQLAARAGSASVTTFGVSSGRAIQTSFDIQGRGPGSAVHGSRLFIIDSEANDFANRDASGNYYNAYTTGMARQFGWAVRAMFARLSARAVVEQTAGTVAGTWTRNFALASASGGSIDATAEANAYIDIPVTITEEDSGVVYLMLARPDTTGTAAPVEVSVDGTVRLTVPTLASPMVKIYSGRAPAPITTVFDPIKVGGLAPGDHIIRVKHAGTAGQYLQVDCILVQAASPEPIIYLRDQPPVAGRGASTPLGTITEARRNVYLANKAASDAELPAIFADFPNVIVIDHNEYLDAGSLSAADGLHPNDRGNARIAEKIFRVLAVRGQNADYI